MRHPLPPHHAPGHMPDYLVEAARRNLARLGVHLHPQARAWVLALAVWHERGVYAYADDLPPMTAEALGSIRQGLVWSEEVGVYPLTRPGYYLTISGLVWVREQSHIPQQMPLFGGVYT